MNVLLVSEPGVDGVFRYVEAFAAFLIDQRITVHLAYSDRRGSEALGGLVSRVEQAGGRTVNLHTSNRPAWSDVHALRVLRALVKEVRPDVIHSHSSKAGALARALPLTGCFGARHVYHPHAYIGMRPKRGRIDFVYDNIERMLGHWSTTVNCSSDENRYALDRLHLPSKRAVLVPNGVATTRFQPATPERREELRAKFGLPAGAWVLGAMGRASAQKDPITLYRAFAKAAAVNADLVLFHVGHGELDGELEEFLESCNLRGRVVRLPYLATPLDFYQAVDGFALTSRYEGFSLALLEALSCGLPIILSDAPGNGELIKRSLTHFWHAPVGDVAVFARIILTWAKKCAEGAAFSNHRMVAQEYYDQLRCFARVLALYRGLLAGRAAKAAETFLHDGSVEQLAKEEAEREAAQA